VEGRRINRILIQKPPHRRTEPPSREISSPIAVGPGTRAAAAQPASRPSVRTRATAARRRRRTDTRAGRETTSRASNRAVFSTRATEVRARCPNTRTSRKAISSASNTPAITARYTTNPNTHPRHLNPPQHLSRRNLLLLRLHNLTQDTRAG
jgi:hypothetical protein